MHNIAVVTFVTSHNSLLSSVQTTSEPVTYIILTRVSLSSSQIDFRALNGGFLLLNAFHCFLFFETRERSTGTSARWFVVQTMYGIRVGTYSAYTQGRSERCPCPGSRTLELSSSPPSGCSWNFIEVVRI